MSVATTTYTARVEVLFSAENFSSPQTHWTEVILDATSDGDAVNEAAGIVEMNLTESITDDLATDGYVNPQIEEVYTVIVKRGTAIIARV